MFTKIMPYGKQFVASTSIFADHTIDWATENSKHVKSYISDFACKNAKRISAFMLASKMFSITVLLALVPLTSGTVVKIKTENVKPQIKIDESKPLTLVGKDRQVAINSGMSNIDLAEAQKTGKYIASADVEIASLDGAERDPSYFVGLYQRAGATYNVPWQLIQAVHYIETGCSDSTSEASYAGATGPMQFMPGTWSTYAVDGNGDGAAQITNVDDAIFGAANLLAAGGAAEGDYQSALFNYNHAQWYVDKVMNVARDAGMSG